MSGSILNFMTINCQRGFRKEELRKFLHKVLRDENEIDFLLLQEANEPVYEILGSILHDQETYMPLYANNPATGKWTEQLVIARKECAILDCQYKSFAEFVPNVFSEAGSFIIKLHLSDQRSAFTPRIVLASTHLHANWYRKARRNELQYLKEELLNMVEIGNEIVLIGGDMNFLIKGEQQDNDSRMRPEFVNVSTYVKHSYDMSRIDDNDMLNKFLKFISKLGLRYRNRIDHFYIDSFSNEMLQCESEVIEEVVSDHFPVMLKVSSKV